MPDEANDDRKNTEGATTGGRVPGQDWRLVTTKSQKRLEWANEGIFDELRVDHWLHIEQMTTRTWSMMVGDARLAIHVGKDGRITVDIERGFYGEPFGATREDTPDAS